jgi:hypothetical protein
VIAQLTGSWPHLSGAAYHATGSDKNAGTYEARHEIAGPSTKTDAEQSKQPTGYGRSGIIAAFAGGFAAGRLAGQPKESTGGWHGLTAWAVTTLVIFYLLTSAVGSILGGAYNTITSAVGNVASTAAGAVRTAAQAAAPGIAQATNPFSSIEQSLRSATGGNDPAALRDAATVALRAALTGDQAQAEETRERAAQAIAKAQNIPVEQARPQVQQYEQQYRQAVDDAKQKATQAADVSAKAVSRGALLGSIALLLGAIAAWFGGRAGAVDPTITSEFLRTPVGRSRARTATT